MKSSNSSCVNYVFFILQNFLIIFKRIEEEKTKLGKEPLLFIVRKLKGSFISTTTTKNLKNRNLTRLNRLLFIRSTQKFNRVYLNQP